MNSLPIPLRLSSFSSKRIASVITELLVYVTELDQRQGMGL